MHTLKHNYWVGKCKDVSIQIDYTHYSLSLGTTEPQLIFLDNRIWVYERGGVIYARLDGRVESNWKDEYFLIYS